MQRSQHRTQRTQRSRRGQRSASRTPCLTFPPQHPQVVTHSPLLSSPLFSPPLLSSLLFSSPLFSSPISLSALCPLWMHCGTGPLSGAPRLIMAPSSLTLIT